MKKYEKILLLILGVLTLANLLLQGSVYLFVCTFLTIWLIGLSYLLGGHSLFYINKEKEAYLPLFAGLSYGPAVITLSFSTCLQAPDYFVYFPIPTLLLTVGLAIYILLKRKKGGIDKEIRMIFYRGLVLSLVSSFFLYTPTSFKPYRKVLMALNSGHSTFALNIAMMDAIMESESAFDKEDCDGAIHYALEANNYAKTILDYKELEEDDSYQMRVLISRELNDDTIERLNPEALKLFTEYKGEEHLYPINRTYRTLFNAYYCKGENLYTQKQYKKALSHYVTAYNYLTTTPIKSVYWQEQKSDILNMIGHCYRQLNKIELSASFFMLALTNYNEATNKTDIDLISSSYVSNIAFLMSSQNAFEESNELLESINIALLKEEQTEKHKKVLLNNYQAQSYNYLALDHIEQAFASIEKAQKLVDPHSSNYCNVQYILAFCQFKANQFKEAETTVKNCLRCFEETSTSSSLKSIEGQTLLGQIKFALGQFDQAKAQITLVMDLTVKSHGKTNDLYAYNSILLGDINKILGNYSIAQQNYTTALELYNSGQVTQTHNIPLVLAGQADLSLLLADFSEAQFLIDKALDGAALTLIPSSPNVAHIYSQAAYIAYHRNNLTIADTLYQKSILIAENYNLSHSLLSANAHNGLGLVEMNRTNYVEANKHFQEALKLYQKIVSDKSPFTAQVYLNYGILHLREGKWVDAETKLKRSLQINQEFFKADHPIFGDLYAAFGDLALKKGERDMAQQQYQKALTIYRKYFKDTHWKVRETQQKLK